MADPTLVPMAGQRRPLLAHTALATVVDPEARDDLGRSVLGAIGPGRQERKAPVRAAGRRRESDDRTWAHRGH